MSNENNIPTDGAKPEHHQSWLGHIVEEIKEKIDELVEEAQNNGGEFSVVGNGHVNVVHDHHKHADKEEKKEETEEDTKEAK